MMGEDYYFFFKKERNLIPFFILNNWYIIRYF
jgi:hypothetical protein